MPTIKDIAAACGVSPATVSHVLNSHHGEVSEETRERVLQVIRQMNYRPGKGNGHQSSNEQVLTIGVCGSNADQISLDKKYIFFRTMVVTLSASIDAIGYHTLLFSSRQLHLDPLKSIHAYCDGRCDGMVVVGPNIDPVLGASLRERGFPHVVIGEDGSAAYDACYGVDNVASTHLAIDELIKIGHRRIAFCNGPEGFTSAQGRRDGYQKAFRAAGIPIIPGLVSPPLASDEQAYHWVRSLCQNQSIDRPTAIFCFNDHYARASLRAAREQGLLVPFDLSVVGFDDLSGDADEFPLTTIRQPYEIICESAIAELVSMIQGKPIRPGQRRFMGQIVRRQSVAAPASKVTKN